MLEWMGLNSYDYDGLQPKMSVGMIKLHECSGSKSENIKTSPNENQKDYNLE